MARAKKAVITVKKDIEVNGDPWFKKGEELKNPERIEHIGYRVAHPIAPRAWECVAIVFDHEVKVA